MQIDASDCLLAGALSLHRTEVGPLVHHPTVGKPADAVLAARAFANLALAATLRAKYRRRIRKRPRVVRAGDRQGKEDEPDRAPQLVLLFVSVSDTLLHGREASHASRLSR